MHEIASKTTRTSLLVLLINSDKNICPARNLVLGTYEGGRQNRFGRKVKSELSEYKVKISTGFDGLSQNHYKKYSFNKKCS